MKTRLMIGAGMVALIGLTACGGGGDSGLDKQDFIAQADAICRKADDTRNDIADDISNASSLDEAAGIVKDKLIPTFEDKLDDLRALKPNGDIEDEVNAIFDSLESGIKQWKTDPGSVLQSDTNPLEDASSKAQDFGFEDCGNTQGSDSSGQTDTTDNTDTTDATQSTDQTQATDGTQTTDGGVSIPQDTHDQITSIIESAFPKLTKDQVDCLTNKLVDRISSGSVDESQIGAEIPQLLDQCNIKISDITP